MQLIAISAAADYCEYLPALVQIAESVDESARGVSPSCRTLLASSFHEYSRQMFHQEVSLQRVKGEERVYKLFGIIPRKFDYEQEVLNLFTANSSGFFDAYTDTIVLAAELQPDEAIETLAHELRHAQQHRVKRLEEVRDQTLTSDELLARVAVLEGDAMRFEAQLRTHERFQRLLKIAVARGGVPQNSLKQSTEIVLPAVLKRLLEFPYTAGPGFVSRERRSLSHLLSSLPLSSAEVLFQGRSIPMRPYASHRASEQYFQDRMGAVFIGLWIEHWLSAHEARFVEEAWRGDVLQYDGRSMEWQVGCPGGVACERYGLILARAFGARFNGNVTRASNGTMVLHSEQAEVRIQVGSDTVFLKYK